MNYFSFTRFLVRSDILEKLKIMKNELYYNLSTIQLFILLALPCFFAATARGIQPLDEPDTLTLIQISDPHICNLNGYHSSFVQMRQHYGNNIEPFKIFLQSVPKENNVDCLIITGDNIDYYEAESEQGWMLDTQIEQFAHLLNRSDIPIYLTLGNHDIASYWINSDSVFSKGVHQLNSASARAAWIRNISCFKNNTYYSRVFKVDTTAFRLIFLDNGYYAAEESTESSLPFIIEQSQLEWLDNQLKTSTSDVEILFMHIPLPHGKFLESQSIFSSSTRFNNLLSVLEKNSSTRLIFAGHEHINAINHYIFPNGNKLTQIITDAFGRDQDNWRMIKITNEDVIIYFPGSYKIEYVIPLKQK